jgi:hypothetical protein
MSIAPMTRFLVVEAARVLAVGPDPAHHRRQVDDDVGPVRVVHSADLLFVDEVELGRPHRQPPRKVSIRAGAASPSPPNRGTPVTTIFFLHRSSNAPPSQWQGDPHVTRLARSVNAAAQMGKAWLRRRGSIAGSLIDSGAPGITGSIRSWAPAIE